MDLYSREIDDLFGMGSPQQSSLCRGMPQNAVERSARCLPRPKRRRKKKEPEVSLYPSLEAIEGCTSDSMIHFDELEVKTKTSTANPLDALVQAGRNNRTMEDEALQPTSSRRHASSVDPPSPLPRYYSSLTLGSLDSSQSGGSRDLLRDFGRVSLTNNKRKPMVSASLEISSISGGSPVTHPNSRPGAVKSRTLATKIKKNERVPVVHQDNKKRDDVTSIDLLTKLGSSLSIGSTYSGSSGKVSEKDEKANFNTAVVTKRVYKKYEKKKTECGLSRFECLVQSVSEQYSSSAGPQAEPPVQDNETRQQHLEIEPGFMLPLRGASETVTSIKSGFVVKVTCEACRTPLLCIADATFCVCPDCKCVSKATCRDSRILGDAPQALYPSGSVGLGFRAHLLSSS